MLTSFERLQQRLQQQQQQPEMNTIEQKLELCILANWIALIEKNVDMLYKDRIDMMEKDRVDMYLYKT